MSTLESALTDDATSGRRCIFSIAPNAVEAIVIVVEPKREPACTARAAPRGSYLVLRFESSVDEDDVANVAKGRWPGLCARHRPNHGSVAARSRDFPLSRRSNGGRWQHLVSNERSVCSAAVVTPRTVEAVSVRSGVYRKPSRSTRTVPFAVDLRVTDERAGKSVSIL